MVRRMEMTVTKCSMCQTRDMIEMPHADGTLNIFMGCPNCDLSGVGITTAAGKAYLGVGPNSDRP